MRHGGQSPVTVADEIGRPRAAGLAQDITSVDERDGEHVLPFGCGHRQRRRGRTQGDRRVENRVIAVTLEPDHGWDQRREPGSARVGRVVVDQPGKRGE